MLVQPSDAHSDDASFKIGPFECMSLSAFADYTTGPKDFRVNNFSIIERPSITNKKVMVLEVAYSVANRKAGDVQIDGQFFLLEEREGGATAVITANPIVYVVAPGITDTAKGGTFVAQGTLGRAKHICLQIVGDLYD